MWEFLIETHQLPFTAAYALVLVIGLIQIIGLIGGLDLFGVLEDIIPGLDSDAGLEGLESVGFFDSVFGWLELRRVPLLVSVVLFLTVFGTLGLGLQQLCRDFIGMSLHSLVAVPVIVVPSVLITKYGNRVIGKIVPRETTAAVSSDTFVGRVATITIGIATHERPAEAKLIDALGKTHYIMVYSDLEETQFSQGEQVLVVERKGNKFSAIKPDNPHFA